MKRVVYRLITFLGGMLLGCLAVFSPLLDWVLNASIAFIGLAGPGGWFSPLTSISTDFYAAIVYTCLPLFMLAVGVGLPHGIVLWLLIRHRAHQRAMLTGFLVPAAGLAGTQLIGSSLALQRSGMSPIDIWSRSFLLPVATVGVPVISACLFALMLLWWRKRRWQMLRPFETGSETA